MYYPSWFNYLEKKERIAFIKKKKRKESLDPFIDTISQAVWFKIWTLTRTGKHSDS